MVLALGLLCLLWLAGPTHAQPAPPTAPTYSIDQTRYFASPEIEREEFKQCLGEVAAFPNAAPEDPEALDDYLHRAEKLLAQLQRHEAYLRLRASRDMDDRVDSDADDEAAGAMDSLQTAVGTALRARGCAALAKQASLVPDLNRYSYLCSLADRDLPHQLPKEQQSIVDALADPALSNLWTIYQKTLRSTTFAKLNTPDGELDARKDAGILAENSDRSIRQTAWQSRWDGVASRADVYAAILLGVVRLNDRVAHLAHFPDAPTRVYFSRGLERQNVTAVLAAIESHAELFKNYQRLRVRHVTAIDGLADVRSWDLTLPEPGFAVPRLTLDQTRSAALTALAPLGPDYVEHFRQLMDPNNQRMDVAAEQGKRTNGGFSIHAPGVPSGLFVENYGAGLLNASRVIVHEGGHAIHGQLMNENGVSPFYTHGPNWMVEAFATLNEFLLYDSLYRKSSHPKAQAFYLSALIGDITFQLFGSAEEGTLEQSIYDGVIGGQINNAADLDALTLSILKKYEIWPALEPELAHTWALKSLMVQDPLYLVNYLYSGLLATKMFDALERHPAVFQQRYADLLRKGFYAPPEELLRTLFGRDLSQQQLVDDSMKILEARIGALGAIYRKIETTH